MKEVIEGEEAAPKKKREMAPRLTPEQKKYILQNYHSEGVVEVAKKLEINDNQVRNTIKKTRKDLENLVETLATEEEKAKYVKFMEEYLPKRVSVDEEGNVVRKRRGPAKDDTRSLVEEMLRGLAL
ncbi:MAG: hypothetical protein IPH62_19425 [Ignavibacteriae bacterium]|nr:hypothetical protein [Ignavibacteriota bacterium]